ncbi:helix-turn-helix transcriptional regulator, partial [uncultured Muribaculum sp.]
ILPSEALKYGSGSSVEIKHSLMRMKDLDDIAAHIGMNRSAFCTFFRRNKGMTFSQFVTQYRLETACELLKTSQKQVSEICFAVGFNDLPHFIRVFNKETGLSPTKYRKQAKKMS